MSHSSKTGSKFKYFGKQFDQAIIRHWWVLLFVISIMYLYENKIAKLNATTLSFQVQLQELQQKKRSLGIEQVALEQQLASQSDPKWIEFLLIQELGMTPEGQKKIFFKTSFSKDEP